MDLFCNQLLNLKTSFLYMKYMNFKSSIFIYIFEHILLANY